MRILIDAMGGDRAPQAPVLGALRAVKELGVDVTLIGQKEAIEPLLGGESGVCVVDAREVVTMEDDPSTASRFGCSATGRATPSSPPGAPARC